MPEYSAVQLFLVHAEAGAMLPADPAAPLDRETVDELFGVLACEYRRSVLSYLVRTEDGAATVETLVDHLREEGAPGEERAIAVRLYHTTLPRLADVGVVGFDAEQGRVVYREHPLLERLLDLTRSMTAA